MRFLLDTNIVIHLMNDTTGGLPLRLRKAIAFEEASYSVSSVSIWEMSLKVAAGKLDLKWPIKAIPRLLLQQKVGLLPMSIDHALEVAHPEPATRDPFDRLLLAVCVCEGMKLATTDTRLAGHRLVW